MATVEKTVYIRASQETVFREWMQFEQFPHFMEDVEEVQRLDERRLRWVASVDGQREEWTARITELIPNERVAWEAEEGARNSGVVTFVPTAEQGTELSLHLEYEPEGVKERVGDWLGVVDGRVGDALERFKQRVEVPSRGEEAIGREADVGDPSRLTEINRPHEEEWRGVGRRSQTEYGPD